MYIHVQETFIARALQKFRKALSWELISSEVAALEPAILQKLTPNTNNFSGFY